MAVSSDSDGGEDEAVFVAGGVRVGGDCRESKNLATVSPNNSGKGRAEIQVQ